MAEQVPTRPSTSSSRTSQGASIRWSNPDIFSDEYALQNLTISDDAPPSETNSNPHVSAAGEAQQPVDVQSQRGFYNAAASMRRSVDPRNNGYNERHASISSRSDSVGQFHPQSVRASFFSYGTERSSIHRSLSQVSDLTIPRTQSPYQGATGPSHPYGMYPQDIAVTRSPSIATTSTARPRERSYTGPNGPTQPYGMYLQNTVPEDGVGPMESLHPPVSGGFPGRLQNYRRPLGPDAEDADDLVGPDGYTEQLPPYTRYPDGIPPKGGRPGPASVLSVEREQQETSEETLADPFQSQESSPHNDRIYDSTDSTAMAQNETRHREDEGGNFKELVKEKGKKRVCFGAIPLWVVAVLVVILVAIIAGVIGAVVGRARGREQAVSMQPQNQHGPPPAADSTTVVVTLTSLVDATPLTSTPTNLPSLPTGTFYVPLRNPTIHNTSCLSLHDNAWDCSSSVDVRLDISDPSLISVSPRYPQMANQIHFGPQPPQTSQATSLMLMGDKDGMEKGPAWFFQQQYTKVVVISEQDWNRDAGYKRRWIKFPQRRPKSRRFNFGEYRSPQGIAPITAKPWFCYWNNTVLEGFIYVTQNSSDQTESTSSEAYTTSSPYGDLYTTAAASWEGYEAAPSAASTSIPSDPTIPGAPVNRRYAVDPSQMAEYPRDVKIEERRDPNNVIQPYCVHMQIMNDGTAQPLPDEDIVSLNEYKPDDDDVRPRPSSIKEKRGNIWERNSATSACECEWVSL